MKSASQKSEHVIIVPGGLLATRPHADPGCSVPPHEVDGDLAQDGQVASCRALPDAAVILAEGAIEDPMEPIFNRPVPADRLDPHRAAIPAAWPEVADLGLDLAGAGDPADGFHRQHGAQPGPGVQRLQGGSLRADEHAPADQAAMAVVEGIEHRPGRGAAGKTVPLATLLHRQERLAVIGLEHQQVIGASFQDLVGDRLLAAHGVQGHDAVLQRQRLEQRWDRGDLVRLAIDLTLAEGQALLAGPGADQMQGPLRPAAVEGAAQGLAVNGHDLPVEGLGKGLSPGAEAGLEGIRVDQPEDAPEGVVRGNAVRQAQERPQPAQLVTAIERDVVPALGTGDHSAHRDHQDIDQPMINLAGTPRILKRRKVLDQLLNRHRRPPFVDEGRTVTPRYTVKSHQPISCVAPGFTPGPGCAPCWRWKPSAGSPAPARSRPRSATSCQAVAMTLRYWFRQSADTGRLKMGSIGSSMSPSGRMIRFPCE